MGKTKTRVPPFPTQAGGSESGPEQGQKADLRLKAQAAKLQPPARAEMQATRSLGLKNTVP